MFGSKFVPTVLRRLRKTAFKVFNAGVTGTEKTIDWNLANKQKITWDDNVTFTFIDPLDDGKTLTLLLVNDGDGGHTVSWPANVKWNAGIEPSWTTSANERNRVTLEYDKEQDIYTADGWTES